MSYSKNIGHNILSQGTRIVLGAITGIIVARALGPSGQGYAAYILLIFTLLGSFGHFGLGNAVTFFQKKSSLDRTAIYSSNINTIILLSLLLSIPVLLLYYSGILLSGYSIYFVLGGILLMFSTMITTHHQSWLLGDEKIIKNNRISLTIFFAKAFAILLFWLCGWLSPFSFFLISVVAMLAWFVLIQSTMGEPFKLLISTAVLKAEYAYGSLAWAASLFAFLHYRVDQIMIKSYLGTADLGIYTIAVSIAELLFLFPVAINGALVGRLYNLNQKDVERQLISRTLRISVMISALLCLVAVAGAFLIPVVYGAAYAPATILMLILLPGVLFACLPKVLSPWFFSQGRPKVHLQITFISLLCNIILNSMFIPLWGSRGAALASSLSYLLYGISYLIKMKYSEGFTLKELLLVHREDWQILRGLVKR